MGQIQRQYDFSPGTKVLSQQVDDEFSNLVNSHNTLDTDVQGHKGKQVDPTSADVTRDKHVSNNDIKNLQDQINTKTNVSGNHQGTWQGLTPGEASEAINGGRLDVVESQLAENVSHINSKDINAKYPPTPLNGVAGDGVTDDVTNLQAIVDHAGQSVNGTQGIDIELPRGVYMISKPLTLPNRVRLIGSNGRGTIIKATSSFIGTELIHAVNGTVSMFGSQLKDIMLDGNNTVDYGIRAEAWQETSGLDRVVIIGCRIYGVLIENGYGGAAYLPFKDVEIFMDSLTAQAGIRVEQISAVGGFILSVDGATITGSTTNILPVGISMAKDSLYVKGLHVEYCTDAIIVDGAGNLSADTISGSPNSVSNLIKLKSTFTGKANARSLIPYGATQTVTNEINSEKINGAIPEYVYPAIRSNNTAFAWVIFDGTTATPTVISSHNVSDVAKTAVGKFQINFKEDLDVSREKVLTGTTNMATNNPALVTASPGGGMGFETLEVRRFNTGTWDLYDPQRCRVVIYCENV
jgi:hypothetical protein